MLFCIDHTKYHSVTTLIRKVTKKEETFAQILKEDSLFNDIKRIRNKRMEEYLQNNRECIRQEVENICVLELERIKNLAGQGEQPYKRLWEIRQNVLGRQEA